MTEDHNLIDNLNLLKEQNKELKEALFKLNDRFSGMGKTMMENSTRLEKMIEFAVQPPKIRMVYPNKSTSCGLISTALSKAQSEIDNVSASGSANRGSYATFGDMLKTIKPVLEKYELAVTSQLVTNELGEFTLIMTLSHKSGEWFESRALLCETKSSASVFHQQIGAAETYLLRYMLRAMLCLDEG